MATRRKPWPTRAAEEYKLLVEQSRLLSRMLKLCIEKGIGGGRNIPLLKRLLPLVAAESRNIQMVCQKVQNARRGRGRWPNWAAQALEDIAVLAEKAEKTGGMAHNALEKNNWPLMERMVRMCLKAAQDIEGTLLEGPPPEDIPLALCEAAEVAEQAFLED